MNIRWLVLLTLSSLQLFSEPIDQLRLENFDYPFLVHQFTFSSQKQTLEMAYMELRPVEANAETVVLLHGKNFSGAYWGPTAETLWKAGYHVIIPDQIGFGKSSKPENYQFTFQQLSLNTRQLLDHCGVTKIHLVGNSMGGMLGIRFALMYPQETQTLTLVDPIGLEDWLAKGVPYSSIDHQFQKELNQTPEKLRAYETASYYHGDWKPAYKHWVDMLNVFITSPDYPRMAWDQALTTDMIMTQPVCHELQNLKMPVLLIIGQADRTALGQDSVSPAVRDTLGRYPELGRKAAATIPNAKLIELDGVGHLPQIEAFPRFISPLQSFLHSHSSRKG